MELDDKFKFAYYARANIHYEFKNQELALQDFQKATNLEGVTEDKQHLKDEHSYCVRGLAKYQIGQDEIKAIEDLEKA